MSDTSFSKFEQYGTNAERLAFTPDPPTGTQVLYTWYETDTGETWVYDTSWHKITGSGAGGINQLTGDVTAGPGVGSQAATIANLAVTTGKIADGAVTAAKLADTTVTPGSYGDATHVTAVTVDQQGRLTAAYSVAITFPSDTGITQLTGDVTAGPGSGSQASTIANDAVTNAKLANVAQSTIKGRASGAGTGDPTDLTPDQASTILDEATDPLSRTSYVDEQIANANVGGAAQNSFLVSGGQIAWLQDYDFLISAATYYINGVLYTSPETSITLDAADPTDDRIDLIIVDDTGTVGKITGDADPNPSEPDIDPGTQLKLGFILVDAASSAPSGAAVETLYYDNAGGPGEWNWTTSGSGFNVNSTNNPKSPSTKDIEGTSVSAGAYAQGAIPSSTYNPGSAQMLVLYIRSKATWANNRGLSVSLRTSGVLQGQAVNINRTGSFGFDSSITGSYQLVAIPVSLFAIPTGQTITQIRITAFGSGHGFYIDDIYFQESATTQTPTGITQAQADARYATLTPGFVTIAAESTLPNERVLTGSANITVTDNGPGSTVVIAATGLGTGNVTTGVTLTNNQLAGGAGGSAVKVVDLTGDVTTSGGLATTIANSVVTPAKQSTAAKTGVITFGSSNGASAVATGLKPGIVRLNYAITITGWQVNGDGNSATATFKIYADDPSSHYPPTTNIVGSDLPALSASEYDSGTALTGWTTSLASGTVLQHEVVSNDNLTNYVLQIQYTRQ